MRDVFKIWTFSEKVLCRTLINVISYCTGKLVQPKIPFVIAWYDSVKFNVLRIDLSETYDLEWF